MNHIGVTTTSRGRTIGPADRSRKGPPSARRGRDRRFAICPGSAHSGEVASPSRTPTDGPTDGPTEPAAPQEVPSAVARLAARAPWRKLPHPLRWLTVAIIGGTFVLVGIALLFLPGPGIAFIILGLAILATEFVWAEALLHKVKNGTTRAWQATKSRIKPGGGSAASPAPQSE